MLQVLVTLDGDSTSVCVCVCVLPASVRNCVFVHVKDYKPFTLPEKVIIRLLENVLLGAKQQLASVKVS